MSMNIKRPYKRNMGFIVRMQLNHKGRTSSSEHKKSFLFLFFRNYYKWVLWFSLSLYFFTSYFVRDRPQSATTATRTWTSASSLSRTTLLLSNHKSSSSVASRALIESSSAINASSALKQGIFNGMKIYVYDLPAKYNSDWLDESGRCATHLFAAEVAIHRALLSSSGTDGARTLDPEEADFFFVPVYVSCNFSTANGFPSLGHARTLIGSAVDYISTQYPFWNRTRGSDHIFVSSHDFGACFHAMEDKAIEYGIPEFMKRSIILQTFGVKHRHPCQDAENVVIPPYISPESVRRTLAKAPANGHRDIWAFFRGKMEVNPKNISGRFYGKGVRTVILKKFGGDRRFYLQRHRFAGYQSEIVRSKFCLCPTGWAPWSPRLVESVVLGCIPVIIADGIRLPFPAVVRWPEISITVAERDTKKLGKILGYVATTNLSVIRRNLQDPAVKRALLYNVPMQQGDATWQVLEALSGNLGRSHRRSRVSSQ